MNRFFNKRMRRILLILAEISVRFVKKLDKSFHADHVVPYSKNGSTNLNNAQALCAQ